MPLSTNPDKDAPRIVGEQLRELFQTARTILGDRLAECRRDPDRSAHLTVVDLTDNDRTALHNTATRLGIVEWTRIERADPAALNDWEQLRHDLIELAEQRPRVLQMYPNPESRYQRPPVQIYLNANGPARAAAAALYERYGDFLALVVGAQPFPPDPNHVPTPRASTEPDREVTDPLEMHLELDGALSIRSGQTTTHALLLHNTSDFPITVNTNGTLTADIIDPATAATVGGFSGAQIDPLITFTAAPGQTVHIPLLVGTASFTPEFGYSIPPGPWQLTAPLDLADGRRRITPPMDFMVTA